MRTMNIAAHSGVRNTYTLEGSAGQLSSRDAAGFDIDHLTDRFATTQEILFVKRLFSLGV